MSDLIDIENEDAADNDAEIIEIDRYDISFFPADYTLSTIFDTLEKGQIIFPEFQREYVWDSSIVRQSRLIESFLLGLPVPQVFLQKRIEDNKLVVVDGLQRLTTIKMFYDGLLKLDGIQPRWVGKTYSTLNSEDRDHLDNQPIRAIIIRQMTPKEDNSSMFYIFERLNTGGMILRPMEIRKAVYWGSFYKLLDEINKTPSWRSVLSAIKFDKRLRDVEWILRVFAIKTSLSRYPGTMKDFLNTTMHRAHTNKIDTSQFKASYLSACELILKEIGPKPFHRPKGRLNISILDVVLAVLLDRPNIKDLKQKFDQLMLDKRFLELLSMKDTARTEIIKERYNLTNKYLI